MNESTNSLLIIILFLLIIITWMLWFFTYEYLEYKKKVRIELEKITNINTQKVNISSNKAY